jgi:tetratricopeptide (TPR) repeat protein
VATVLNNLAGVYYALGRYGETERFLKRALTIREQKLGQDHPDVAQTLNNLALLSARQGRWGEAWKRFLQARESERGVIFQALGMGSQRQQLAFMSTLWPRLEQTLALADMHLRQDPKVVRSACELWLERKGLVLEAQRRLHQALATRGGPRAQKVFARLCELRGRLARLSLAGPGKQGPEAWRKQVQALRRRCEELEGRLASLSRAYALERKQARATVEQVAAGLPAGTTKAR